MKTAEEVKAWLEKQDWYDVFCKRIDEEKRPTNPKKNILNGELLEETISLAFNWEETPEGVPFWTAKDITFYSWYTGKTTYLNWFLTRTRPALRTTAKTTSYVGNCFRLKF